MSPGKLVRKTQTGVIGLHVVRTTHGVTHCVVQSTCMVAYFLCVGELLRARGLVRHGDPTGRICIVL